LIESLSSNITKKLFAENLLGQTKGKAQKLIVGQLKASLTKDDISNIKGMNSETYEKLVNTIPTAISKKFTLEELTKLAIKSPAVNVSSSKTASHTGSLNRQRTNLSMKH